LQGCTGVPTYSKNQFQESNFSDSVVPIYIYILQLNIKGKRK
jgi:hypothetical protein